MDREGEKESKKARRIRKTADEREARLYMQREDDWGEPHTSDTNGTSDRLQTITIKHGKLIYSSIDNYTKNSRNGLLTIYLTEMAY